ncbi:hypothetical protein P43SY_008406 [Pythium insidiosum]|uniref:Elicitin n=1 Tax=Pythium insidiosum TaxID=114742 RepID=A0AAD5LJ74_PYTIN|nr:hypothetical protein P43SY_008405 [Pythium insidiosum]KAJ0400543.1 hypothetical protein P43SY_008406 [Pythium insidiosum]
MKFFAVIAAALVAAVSAQPECDLSKLIPLSGNPQAKTCVTKANYQLVPPTVPTPDQMSAMCKIDECKVLLGELDKLVPTDCKAFGIALRSQIIEPIQKACAAPAPAPTSGAPAPGPTTKGPAPGPTTKAPAPGPTTKPSC